MPRVKKNEEKIITEEQKPMENKLEEIKFTDPYEKKEEVVLVAPPTEKQMMKQKIEKFAREESKLVKGRFRNYETPGGNLRVQIRKYPGIPAFDKVMSDNQIYEIPLYVARHLNGVDITAGSGNTKIHTCAWPTHGFICDKGRDPSVSDTNDQGIPVPIIGVQKWNKRFGFESMEFDTEN